MKRLLVVVMQAGAKTMLGDQLSPQTFGFPTFGYGANSWSKSLGVLLYEGGASVHPATFARLVANGSMGAPQLERLPLVSALHRTLAAFIDAGYSSSSISVSICYLKLLFRFAERNGKLITVDTVDKVFCGWADSLVQRTELAEDFEPECDRDQRPLMYTSVYQSCVQTAQVLNHALARTKSVMALTNVKHQGVRKLTTNATKQHLSIAHNISELTSVSQVGMDAPHPASIDLTFGNIDFGARETPWNFNVLLYRGGAAAYARDVQTLINNRNLGPPLYERLTLVCSLHEEVNARQVAGGSKLSTAAFFRNVKKLFHFADCEGLPMSMETVVDSFCSWTDWLVYRTHLASEGLRRHGERSDKPLKETSAYTFGSTVGALLNTVLERRTSILELTRLKSPPQRSTAIGVQAEKQNLSDTFAFGHLLQDICDALTIQTVRAAPLPIVITLRSGGVVSCSASKAWARMDQTTGLGLRYRIANIRIEAELCMFIGQTGMNLAQAYELTLQRFFYAGHIDGYQVRDHKERRHGPVLFEIFKEYKMHFERYLEWRRTFFPDSNSLFPFIRHRGTLPNTPFDGCHMKSACEQANATYIPPQAIRGTRVNWLLRRTADPDTTAEMSQHTQETLLGLYHRPSLQRALGETITFWNKVDPNQAPTEAVAPGDCEGEKPAPTEHAPRGAPKPDCLRASGCLWCVNHRDVDSFDYVWALVTFKHLKKNELGKGPIPKSGDKEPPSKLVIDRVDEKLKAFESSNAQRRDWVIEAQVRIEEGEFHPSFKDELEEMEDRV